MKNTLRILLLVLLASSSLVYAKTTSWEFAGWYGAGCFPNLVFDPKVKDRVYLASDVGGIFRSDDKGENWHFVTKGLEHMIVAQVAIAPSDSNVLYAATGGGLFISKDAGGSWSALDRSLFFQRPENYRPIAIDAKDPNKWCAGTANGIIACSSGKKMTIGKEAVTALALDTEGKLYASSTKGFFRCDGKCQPVEGAPKPITDFIFSAGSPQTIYAAAGTKIWMSTDTGLTWTASQDVPKGRAYRVALDGSAEQPVLYAVWNEDWKGGVIRSTDRGQTWNSLDKNLQADKVLDPTRAWASAGGKSTGVYADPFDPKVLFRTDWWGVWRSDDGGASWQEKIMGAPNAVATQVAVTANGIIYAASMDNGLLKSVDDGKTYEALFPSSGYDGNKNGHVWRFVTAGDTIIGTSSPWEKQINQIIVSRDGGKNFTLVREGLPQSRPRQNTMWGQGYPRGLAIDPTDPNMVYLGIDGDDGGGLFISKDAGATWERSSGQPGSLRIYNALAVDPTNPKRIIWGACGTNGGVYISEDGGKTFRYSLKQMQWVFGLTVGTDGTIYAVGDSNGPKLFASLDHGKTWGMMVGFGPAGKALVAVAVDPSDPKRIVTGTTTWGGKAPNNIFMSTDGGKKWEDITGDLPDGAGASSFAFDPTGKYLYMSRYAGSVYRLAL